MKKTLLTLLSGLVVGTLFAAQTTYTFTSASFGSKVGTVTTNGTTDGFVCEQAAASYATGFVTPQGNTGKGVQVTAGFSGAAAHSVIEFEQVRSLTFNYCTNRSKGRGAFIIQIGNNAPDTLAITALQTNSDVNRDTTLRFDTPLTGPVRIQINCTTNSIYLHSLTIRASNASPSVQGLTRDAFRLVTDIEVLQDSDEVIFGVADNSRNYVMGLYDENVSRNNIHAVAGSYSADRNYVNPIASAIYTVHRYLDSNNAPYYTFEDATGWYLTASGGNPNNGNNNYLTVWDTIISPSYGRFGAWSVEIDDNGAATITNQGSSRSNKIQFNPNGNTPIFACYSTLSQTPVALYRKESVPDAGAPYIQPTMLNFGKVVLDTNPLTGSQTLPINAMNLEQDIAATLPASSVFSLDKPLLDRDGEDLTISYSVTQAGVYKDTLTLTSGSVTEQVLLYLTVFDRMSIAQVKTQADYTLCYLNDVFVTKKYDKYIFVKDNTGSLLLFDGGNLYGQGLTNGAVLHGVEGKFTNHYGNPSLNLTAAFRSRQGETIVPEAQTVALDTNDVCRYVEIQGAVLSQQNELQVFGQTLPLYDLFNVLPQRTDLSAGQTYTVTGIVYNYNQLVLCPIDLVAHIAEGVENTLQSNAIFVALRYLHNPEQQPFELYNSLGQKLVEGNADYDLSGFPAGVYVIQSAGQTLKVAL